MKSNLFIILIICVSCNKSNVNLCHDYQTAKRACEKEAEKLFNDYGKLKEEYESAKIYIQLLEQENEYLKNQRDSINNSLQN